MRNYLPVVLLLGSAFAVRAEIPAGWSTNYTEALADANKDQKPALFFFTASWCGPCKMMASQTLTDPAVRQAISNFTSAAIDIDEYRDLSSQHAIEAVPTFVLLSPAGDEVRRTTGFQTPADFLEWLTNGTTAVKEAMVRHEAFQKKLAEADQLLASTNADALGRCAAQLLDLCAERDEPLAQSAVQRLRTVAARQPVLLLDGLNDQRLAARIQAANALRLQLGDTFDFDPWADPTNRTTSVANWRKSLTK
jgi:thioredoxin-like negative regulator of GroEL